MSFRNPAAAVLVAAAAALGVLLPTAGAANHIPAPASVTVADGTPAPAPDGGGDTPWG